MLISQIMSSQPNFQMLTMSPSHLKIGIILLQVVQCGGTPIEAIGQRKAQSYFWKFHSVFHGRQLALATELGIKI